MHTVALAALNHFFMKKLFSLLAGIIACIIPASAQNCTAGWNYYMPITVSNPNTSPLTDHQVMITVNTAALVASGHMQSDGDDIRFFSSSVCCEEYPYYIDSGMNSTATKIWVKLPSVPSGGSNTFKMFYGNPTASAGTNGAATFKLFEDYNGPTNQFQLYCSSGTATATPGSGTMTYAWTGAGLWGSDSTFALSGVYTAETNVLATSGDWPELAFAKTTNTSSYSIMCHNSTSSDVVLGESPVPVQPTYCGGMNYASIGSATSTQVGTWSLTWVSTGNIRGTFPVVGTLTSTSTAHAKDAPLRVFLGGAAGIGSMTVDWVRVRKYATITPTATMGAEVQYTSVPAAGGFLGADQNICVGQNVVLDASAYGFTSYLWSTGATTSSITVNTPGSYWVQGTSTLSCALSDTVVLNAIAAASAGTITGNNTICNGFTTNLSTSGHVGTIDWYLFNGSGYVPQGSGAFITVGPLNVAGTYSFVAVATGSCDPDTSAFHIIQVDPTNNAGSVSMPSDLCINAVVTMSTSGYSGSIDWYEFDGSNYMLLAANTNPYTTANPFSAAGTFSVVAVAHSACPDDTSALAGAVIHPSPAATVTAGVSTACFDDGSISLTGTPAGGTFSGPGVSGNSFAPGTAGIGSHIITYSYTDAFGCTGIANTQVAVNLCTGVAEQTGAAELSILPNPNAGTFAIVSATSLQQALVEITDVTGRVVYASQQNNMSVGIPVQVDLSAQPDGIYFVRISSVNTQNVIPVSIAR